MASVEVAVAAIDSNRRMRTPQIFLFALSAGLTPTVQAENSISFQTYKYVESDGRIQVRAADLALEKDFGTDLTARMELGTDAISGATPCWKLKPGYANEYVSGKCVVGDEVRNSFSAGFTWRDAKRNEYTFGFSNSREPDFLSNEFSAQAQLWHNELHNRSYTVGVSLQDNTSLAAPNTNNTVNKGSKALAFQAGVNQVLDRNSTLEASVFAGADSGYLTNHYLKIVRDDGSGQHTLTDELRPDSRRSGGVSTRYIKSWRDDFKTNIWYRYYGDNWGITSHTVEAKAYWDITEKWRLNPVLRLFQQSEANFYRAYSAAPNTFASTGPGSNDSRLGPIKAVTTQLNLEYRASKEWSISAGVSRYAQNTGWAANTATLGFVFKY